MTEETKKALEELKKKRKKLDDLWVCEVAVLGKPAPSVDVDGLADALRETREAERKYWTLYLKDIGWPQEQIDNWLKRANLK